MDGILTLLYSVNSDYQWINHLFEVGCPKIFKKRTFGGLLGPYYDNKELGKFKLEAIEEKAKYVRQKTYITLEKGKYHITCAGMTDEMKEITINTYKDKVFDIFARGFEIGGKLIPKHVKGGIVLYETTFRIRA